MPFYLARNLNQYEWRTLGGVTYFNFSNSVSRLALPIPAGGFPFAFYDRPPVVVNGVAPLYAPPPSPITTGIVYWAKPVAVQKAKARSQTIPNPAGGQMTRWTMLDGGWGYPTVEFSTRPASFWLQTINTYGPSAKIVARGSNLSLTTIDSTEYLWPPQGNDPEGQGVFPRCEKPRPGTEPNGALNSYDDYWEIDPGAGLFTLHATRNGPPLTLSWATAIEEAQPNSHLLNLYPLWRMYIQPFFPTWDNYGTISKNAWNSLAKQEHGFIRDCRSQVRLGGERGSSVIDPVLGETLPLTRLPGEGTGASGAKFFQVDKDTLRQGGISGAEVYSGRMFFNGQSTPAISAIKYSIPHDRPIFIRLAADAIHIRPNSVGWDEQPSSLAGQVITLPYDSTLERFSSGPLFSNGVPFVLEVDAMKIARRKTPPYPVEEWGGHPGDSTWGYPHPYPVADRAEETGGTIYLWTTQGHRYTLREKDSVGVPGWTDGIIRYDLSRAMAGEGYFTRTEPMEWGGGSGAAMFTQWPEWIYLTAFQGELFISPDGRHLLRGIERIWMAW